MKKLLLTLSVINLFSISLINTNQVSNDHKSFATNQILQKNVDNFQKLSNNKYLTTNKEKAFSIEKLYLWSTNTKQKTDLNINVLSRSYWAIDSNIFVASDGEGNSYIYDITNPQVPIKITIDFLKGTAIVYTQKISDKIYLLSYPDKNLNASSALVDFSNINNLKYTLLPNNPWVTNGNPVFVLNNHSFIITVTTKDDWVYCDISDFNHPIYYSLFNSPYFCFSSVNSLSDNQILITINDLKNDSLITQLWTMNNENPNLWIKQTINNFIINSFIIIKPNLAIIGLKNQLDLFLLDYSNWNNLKITTIPNSQNIKMLDSVTLYPTVSLIIMNNQIVFNDFNNNKIKVLNFSYLNNITIKSLQFSLASYFAGLYTIVKENNQNFVTIDQNQNFILVTL